MGKPEFVCPSKVRTSLSSLTPASNSFSRWCSLAWVSSKGRSPCHNSNRRSAPEPPGTPPVTSNSVRVAPQGNFTRVCKLLPLPPKEMEDLLIRCRICKRRKEERKESKQNVRQYASMHVSRCMPHESCDAQGEAADKTGKKGTVSLPKSFKDKEMAQSAAHPHLIQWHVGW